MYFINMYTALKPTTTKSYIVEPRAVYFPLVMVQRGFFWNSSFFEFCALYIFNYNYENVIFLQQNTMKNQWKNQEQVPDSAHQPLVYHPDDDVMVEQQTHDMHFSANQYIDPVSNPPHTEYTNSGIIQDYRTDDGHAGNAVSGYGEDYFVESTEHNSHYNSGLHTDAFGNQFDQYGAPVGSNHTDNYFLLQKDFVPGMESIGYTDEVTEL